MNDRLVALLGGITGGLCATIFICCTLGLDRLPSCLIGLSLGLIITDAAAYFFRGNKI